MPPPRSLLIERFKRLPRRSNDAWQGGLVRARTWIEQPDGSVRRPWAAVWVSLATGTMNIQLVERTADADHALQVLVDLGLKFVRCRPARLEVTDARLGAQLAEALADAELGVSVRADLPAVDQVLRAMEEAMTDAAPLPEALEAPGVTVERMRAFAEAARELYAAAPWEHLSDEDLVHVEAPAVASGCVISRCSALPARRSASASLRAGGTSRPCTRRPIRWRSSVGPASGRSSTAPSTRCRLATPISERSSAFPSPARRRTPSACGTVPKASCAGRGRTS